MMLPLAGLAGLLLGLSPAHAQPVPGIAAGAQASFTARCRQAYLAQDRNAARWADSQCAADWQKVVATGPAAAALIAALPASGERPVLASLKARMAGVRWNPRPDSGSLATGRIGVLAARIDGRGQPASAGVAWGAVGAEIPFDMVGALIARGATLMLMSCEQLGAGEGMRRFAGTLPGRAPFTLSIDQRTAPTGNAQSHWFAAVSLDGRHPPRGPTSPCDFL
jgi:hypothetical protein